MIEENLRPCPFCGAKAKLLTMTLHDGQKFYGVFCSDDLAQKYQHGHYIDNFNSKQIAIDTWNGKFYLNSESDTHD